MQFGHFDDAACEYVITTPHTPYPWINYLGSEQFFSLLSHQAGGYSFYRDAKMRRLTRYRYNNLPTDADEPRVVKADDVGGEKDVHGVPADRAGEVVLQHRRHFQQVREQDIGMSRGTGDACD